MSTLETEVQATPEDIKGTYTLDTAHSRIGFVARHAMVTKVRGSFNKVEGSGYFDPSAPETSHLEVKIDAESIDTRNEDRDTHLKSNDFLDLATYPEITFKSTKVVADGDTGYKVTGDLTIKGVTKPVTVDFEYTGAVIDPWGNRRIGFEGSTTINRKDWGISFNVALEAGGVLVSDKITLEFEVAAVKSAE